MRQRTPNWKPHQDPASRVGTAMAHRRGLRRIRFLRWLVGVGMLASGLAIAVLVTGQVTELRESVAVLGDQRACLAAHNAKLQSGWAGATRPDVVRSRARCELGFVVPDEPEYVLIARRMEPANGPGLWQRVLEGFGGGTPALAAAPVIPASATSMISVHPRGGTPGRTAS